MSENNEFIKFQEGDARRYHNPEFSEYLKLGEYLLNIVPNDYTYFSSNDMRIRIMPSGRFGLIDFLPRNQMTQVKEEKFAVVGMFYAALANFIYVYEKDQIPMLTEETTLSNPTNKIMANFATHFGFKIEDGREFLIKGKVGDIKTSIEEFKTSPIIQRVLKSQKI